MAIGVAIVLIALGLVLVANVITPDLSVDGDRGGQPHLRIRRTLARWIFGSGAYAVAFLLLVAAFVTLALQLPEGTAPDGPHRTAGERAAQAQ